MPQWSHLLTSIITVLLTICFRAQPIFHKDYHDILKYRTTRVACVALKVSMSHLSAPSSTTDVDKTDRIDQNFVIIALGIDHSSTLSHRISWTLRTDQNFDPIDLLLTCVLQSLLETPGSRVANFCDSNSDRHYIVILRGSLQCVYGVSDFPPQVELNDTVVSCHILKSRHTHC